MKHINVEIKARNSNPSRIRAILKGLGADFRGEDHQIDTYYNSPKGRLKLRSGNIENSLIYYERENKKDSKESKVILFPTGKDLNLKEILERSLGIKAIVDKKREIYFIENVKFHLDVVNDLGNFVEIEAISVDGKIPKDKLLEQCNHYKELFGIEEKDLIKNLYSDLIMEEQDDKLE